MVNSDLHFTTTVAHGASKSHICTHSRKSIFFSQSTKRVAESVCSWSVVHGDSKSTKHTCISRGCAIRGSGENCRYCDTARVTKCRCQANEGSQNGSHNNLRYTMHATRLTGKLKAIHPKCGHLFPGGGPLGTAVCKPLRVPYQKIQCLL